MTNRHLKTSIRTLLIIILFFYLNSGVFLFLIGKNFIDSRPWTLFLSQYANSPVPAIRIAWQIFLALSVVEAIWFIYKAFRTDIHTRYFLYLDWLEKKREESEAVNHICNITNKIKKIIGYPFYQPKTFFYYVQLIFMLIANLIIWTVFFLNTQGVPVNLFHKTQALKHLHVLHEAVLLAFMLIILISLVFIIIKRLLNKKGT